MTKTFDLSRLAALLTPTRRAFLQGAAATAATTTTIVIAAKSFACRTTRSHRTRSKGR